MENNLANHETTNPPGEPVVVPPVYGEDSGGEVNLRIALAGVGKDDVTILADKEFLTVETLPVKFEQQGKALIKELGSHRYLKKFRLSNDLDTDALEASLEDGVLKIVIPYKEELRPKRITVN